MKRCSRVGELLDHFNLRELLQQRIGVKLGSERALKLLSQLDPLPLRSSRAATRLGAYQCRAGEPLAISLQFAQEEEQLRQTLLHEIAHFLDHQTRGSKDYRNPHGPSWQDWLECLGAAPGRGDSPALKALYRQRLKPVARCKRCGYTLHRLRRLTRGRRWLHRECGGQLLPID